LNAILAGSVYGGVQSKLLEIFSMKSGIRSNHHIFWSLVFGLVTATGLTACGGGGGSTAGGGGVPVSYTGVTTAAIIEIGNAAPLSSGAVNGVTTSAASGGALLGVTTSEGTASSMTQVVKKLAAQAATPVSDTAVPLGLATGTSTIPGSCGGSVMASANQTSLTTVEGTITYNNYCEAGIVFVSGTNNFTAYVTVNSPNVTINSIMITTAPNALLSIYVQHAGRVYWANDLDLTVNAQSSYDDVTVSATYYHPTYGYVTLTTPPVLHILAGNSYPSSGSMLLTDTANHHALVTAVSATDYQLQIDADGVAGYETTTSGSWNSL
jgi:hypothetical protein